NELRPDSPKLTPTPANVNRTAFPRASVAGASAFNYDGSIPEPNPARSCGRGTRQRLQAANGRRDRRGAAYDRADPGPDSLGPWRGHALQGQGSEPEDQGASRQVVPRDRQPPRVELRAPGGPVPLPRHRSVPLHGRRRLQPVLAPARRTPRPGPL